MNKIPKGELWSEHRKGTQYLAHPSSLSSPEPTAHGTFCHYLPKTMGCNGRETASKSFRSIFNKTILSWLALCLMVSHEENTPFQVSPVFELYSCVDSKVPLLRATAYIGLPQWSCLLLSSLPLYGRSCSDEAKWNVFQKQLLLTSYYGVSIFISIMCITPFYSSHCGFTFLIISCFSN